MERFFTWCLGIDNSRGPEKITDGEDPDKQRQATPEDMKPKTNLPAVFSQVSLPEREERNRYEELVAAEQAKYLQTREEELSRLKEELRISERNLLEEEENLSKEVDAIAKQTDLLRTQSESSLSPGVKQGNLHEI